MRRVAKIGLVTHWCKEFSAQETHGDSRKDGPSPRQPLSRQVVLTIPGYGRNTLMTTENVHELRKADFNMRIGTMNGT